jgi:hypothetical protein
MLQCCKKYWCINLLALQVWGLGMNLTTPPCKKNIVTKPQEEAKAHPGL